VPANPKPDIHRFTHLRVARSRQHGEAPYKPALLLAVLDGIEDGSIRDNRIYITPELLAAFRSLCRDSSPGQSLPKTPKTAPAAQCSRGGFAIRSRSYSAAGGVASPSPEESFFFFFAAFLAWALALRP
jgi:hypothetical protein